MWVGRSELDSELRRLPTLFSPVGEVGAGFVDGDGGGRSGDGEGVGHGLPGAVGESVADPVDGVDADAGVGLGFGVRVGDVFARVGRAGCAGGLAGVVAVVPPVGGGVGLDSDGLAEQGHVSGERDWGGVEDGGDVDECLVAGLGDGGEGWDFQGANSGLDLRLNHVAVVAAWCGRVVGIGAFAW